MSDGNNMPVIGITNMIKNELTRIKFFVFTMPSFMCAFGMYSVNFLYLIRIILLLIVSGILLILSNMIIMSILQTLSSMS